MPAPLQYLTLEELKASTGAAYPAAFIIGPSNQAGPVFWSGLNAVAGVLNNPEIYITPSSDPTGASGAWHYTVPPSMKPYSLWGTRSGTVPYQVDIESILYRAIYIHAVTGNDNNSGVSPESAIRTFAKAVTLLNYAGRNIFLLCSDLTISTQETLQVAGFIKFNGRVFNGTKWVEGRRKMTFLGSASNKPGSRAGISLGMNEIVQVANLDVAWEASSATNHAIFSINSASEVLINSCDLLPPAAGNGCLFATGIEMSDARVSGCTKTGLMAGRYFLDVAAKRDPKLSRFWSTNVTLAMNST